jgi:hypothetical protein
LDVSKLDLVGLDDMWNCGSINGNLVSGSRNGSDDAALFCCLGIIKFHCTRTTSEEMQNQKVGKKPKERMQSLKNVSSCSLLSPVALCFQFSRLVVVEVEVVKCVSRTTVIPKFSKPRSFIFFPIPQNQLRRQFPSPHVVRIDHNIGITNLSLQKKECSCILSRSTDSKLVKSESWLPEKFLFATS